MAAWAGLSKHEKQPARAASSAGVSEMPAIWRRSSNSTAAWACGSRHEKHAAAAASSDGEQVAMSVVGYQHSAPLQSQDVGQAGG